MPHQPASVPEEGTPSEQGLPEPEADGKPSGQPAGDDSRGGPATEAVIGWILRVGVSASALLILAGVGLLFFTGNTGYGNSLGTLSPLVCYTCSGGQRFPTSPGEVLAGLAHLYPYALIALGLLVLIATPVVRVAASVLLFLLERDLAYVLITLVVLTILIISFLLGKAG